MSRTETKDKGLIPVKIVEELAGYDDIRVATTAATIVDFYLNLRNAGAMECMVALTKHDDVLRAVSTPQNTERIIKLLADLDWRVRMTAVQCVVALIKHGGVRGLTSMPVLVEGIIEALCDSASDVRQSAINAVIALANIDHSREVICTAENIGKIVGMLRHDEWYARHAVMVEGLVMHDAAFMVMSAEGTFETILVMLEDRDSDVRRSAVDTIVAFAAHENPRAIVSAPQNVTKITKMLWDDNWRARQVALQIVEVLAPDDSICAEISTVETLQRMVAMLGDEDSDVRESTVNALSALAKHDVPRTMISTTENLETIMTFLAAEEWRKRQSALQILETLLQHDDIRGVLSRHQTIQTIRKFIRMLGDPVRDVQESAFNALAGLSQHGKHGGPLRL
ncbi:armadillo-type protein [Mycena latifolia]|nr:armadillo-type protein [Mycena latifolia]